MDWHPRRRQNSHGSGGCICRGSPRNTQKGNPDPLKCRTKRHASEALPCTHVRRNPYLTSVGMGLRNLQKGVISALGFRCEDSVQRRARYAIQVRPEARDGCLTMKAQIVRTRGAWCALAALVYGCGTSPSSVGSIAAPAGCAPDTSLVCESGGDGWRCDPGDNPETEESGLSCSIPQPDGSNDDFCCIAWPSAATSCTPDDELGAYCWYPSYGYQCESGGDPGTLDPSLNCSAPSTDADGVHADFCCQ
jgi:hypothetical protein